MKCEHQTTVSGGGIIVVLCGLKAHSGGGVCYYRSGNDVCHQTPGRCYLVERHRAEVAEAERDKARAKLAALRTWLNSKRSYDWFWQELDTLLSEEA